VFLGVEGHRVQGALAIILGKYASRNIVRGIGFHNYFAVVIEVIQNQCGRECRFKVVKEGRAEVVQELVKYVIDESLEVGWCIGEAEWHYQRFEQTVSSPEGHLPLFPLRHSYQVVGTVDI